jgi:acyl carrier protein
MVLTELQRKIVLAAARILAIPPPRVDDNFFELGADSLSALELVEDLNDRGIIVSVEAVYQARSFAEIAASAEHPA